ncbi:MAG: acyl-ACP--UDP-N-acetylglucosamine O-acyltransferase [Vicinamibacteraceae bacterium]|nr:acyl-ACP--UDP-N-acetylglucosamine O-acyltransferase [Vicinamibacteraceae bacterium]
MPVDVLAAAPRLASRFPAPLADTLASHEPGARLVVTKQVSVSEDFFTGHFPGAPVLPGVLIIEAIAQAATALVLADAAPTLRASLRGVANAKFRRQVAPGDTVTLDVQLVRRRGPLVRVRGVATVAGQPVAEADVLLGLREGLDIHPTAIVHDGAVIGAGTRVGPHAVIGPHVRLGRRNRVGASVVIDGRTEIGDDNEFFPFASIGLAPQDLKYADEPTRLVIGHRNVFREAVTVHRGTAGGGGVTSIGDRNLFMAYAHVAHDCHVGSETIFGNAATLGGHVHVGDFATISAYSGVHQFCRVGRHAFIGGYTVVTKDALPFAKTVGNRARLYGLNTIGLVRRGFAPEVVRRLRGAYRLLLVSKLNASQALDEIARSEALACDEVRYLVDFIHSSPRGVTLRRGSRRLEEGGDDA